MSPDSPAHPTIAALVARCTSFEWDAGNKNKNWKKHLVSDAEAEEVFANRPLQFSEDPRHSATEIRFAALGKTDGNRLLATVFTIRDNKIRIISARPMSRSDRRAYSEKRP